MPEENTIVSSISAKELSLNKIFCSDYSFEIPIYQRPYSWKTEHASQLLEDISDFALREEAFNKIPPYFVGSLVLIKESDKRLSKVVDGQQRLTTFTILISVLRHLIKDDSVKADLTRMLNEPGSIVNGTKDDFRLKLRKSDQDYFNKIIQTAGGLDNLDLNSEVSESQMRIRENAAAFIETLSKLEEPSLLIKLVQFIAQRCFMVIVTSTDEDSAFRIFNVLNDRGLQLSHADILKSEVLESIEEKDLEDYNTKWETAEETLGIERFKELFNHIRPIYAKKKAEESVLKEIRKYANPAKSPKEFIDTVLLPYSAVYGHILNKDYVASTHAEKINARLKWLNRFENTDWIPPVLMYMSIHKANPTAISKFLDQLDRLALALEILGANITTRITRFASVNTWIEQGKDLFDAQSPLLFTAKEEEKIKTALMGTNMYGRRYVKILLLKIDEALSGGGATYDYPIISIEHVLPQTPAAKSNWVKLFTEKERESLTNSIGNLLLLTMKKNIRARNYDLDEKKKKYFAQNGISPFAITTAVLSYTDWTPDIVNARKKEMANQSLSILGLSQIP